MPDLPTTGGWAAVILAVLVAGWTIYKQWFSKKAKEEKRLKEERKKQSEQVVKEREKEISDAAAHDAQDKTEERLLSKDIGVPVVLVDAGTPIFGEFRTRTHWPRGAVVHYTAGRPVTSAEEAKAHLKDMASRGLGAFLMGTDGKVYCDSRMGRKTVVFHAGDSEWKGEKNLSRMLMGIEIACPGKLKNEYGYTWYGDQLEWKDYRSVSESQGYLDHGWYAKFTEAQEQTLINMLVWQARHNPEFDCDWIVGHDEIAPGRKQDPGGSLSMPMSVLRRKIKELA